MTWIKRHERKLWWGFLLVSIVVGQVRNPDCNAPSSLWWYVVPTLLVFVGIFVFSYLRAGRR